MRPAAPPALTRTLDRAAARAVGMPVHAYPHRYRPPAESARVLAVAEASAAAGTRVQRHGHLADEKPALLGAARRD